jgi:hypothetical protein
MSLGAGMAVGMGAGMGAGISVGVAAGRKQALEKIRDYARTQGATVQNAGGKPLDWDEFLDEALVGGAGARANTALVLGLLAGLGLVVLGLILFFLLR